MTNIDYSYEEIPANGNQYDAEDFSFSCGVDAKYIRSQSAPGNPFVEALPRPRSLEVLYEESISLVHVPTPYELSRMDRVSIEESISSLKDGLRIPLPFYHEFEKEFYLSLTSAYKHKTWDNRKNADIMLTTEDRITVTHGISRIARMSEPPCGITLIGESGCGKTTCVNMILSRYPQVIVHKRGTFDQRYQIVWIHVNCQPNSNFNALYAAIGHEIDRALGNITPVYEQEIKKTRTLGEKLSVICRLFDTFSVGVLVVDEIQEISVSSTAENTYDALMTLTNQTGTVLVSVGTEKAYKKIFSKSYLARRNNHHVDASNYCSSRSQFSEIVNSLTYFQWREKRILYTEDMVDVLFKASRGIISNLIDIYITIEKLHIRGEEPDVVDASYLRDVTENKYGKLTAIYKSEASENTWDKITFFGASPDRQVSEVMSSEEPVSGDEYLSNRQLLKSEVVLSVMEKRLGFRQAQIEKTYDRITAEMDDKDITKTAVTKAVLDDLKRNRDERRKKDEEKKSKPKFSHDKARKALRSADSDEGKAAS